MLALANLKGMTEDDVKAHISGQYGGDKSGFEYGEPTEQDAEFLASELKDAKILVAYESVGSWGCDSSSFFLIEKGGVLFENHGGHCSCYGFEGQWAPDETTKESLQKRSYFSMGGYDEESEANQQAIRDFVASLPD